MKKRFKKKKSFKSITIKIIIVFVLFYLCSYIVKKIDQVSLNLNISASEFIKYVITSSNHNIDYEYNKKSSITKVFGYFTSFNLNEPSTIIDTVYKDLVDEKEIIKENSNGFIIEEHFIEDVPLVYIYNTHPLENYQMTNNLHNFTPNITTASYILQSKLKDLGIKSIVEENSVSDILKSNNWAYSSSYKVSRMFMTSAKEKYPSLKYFIDIHRDSVTKDVGTINVNGVNYARLLFVIGLENKKFEDNKSVASILNNKLNGVVPNLSRGLYEKEGPGVNGVYNQDFSKNTILLEVGGYQNNLEEVNISTQIFAKVLYDYIGDDKK